MNVAKMHAAVYYFDGKILDSRLSVLFTLIMKIEKYIIMCGFSILNWKSFKH